MKKVLITAVSAFAGVALWAGGVAPESKVVEKMVEQPAPCECFRAGEIQLDVFGAWAASTANNDILENNGWGGGIGANYFITKYFGIGAEGYWLAVDSTLHGVSGSVIARLPFESGPCWAPYVFVGGGGLFDGSSMGTAHAGAGFDIRLTKKIGLIIDSRFNFGGLDEYTLTRAGLRFSF
ncbi:MAG TPA: hypothetical protein PLU30_06315 [Verrucomicrobiae bacterium]|nr:hypothetical protein [Verrucomicrobiae bacterium]